MPSVEQLIGTLGKIQSADIRVHQHRCVQVRNRNAGCLRCAEVCTSGAISVEDNQLVIEPGKCIGCGTCATVCPTCALEARKPGDRELMTAVLFAAGKNDGVAVLSCGKLVAAAGKALDPDRVVAVECLGRVDETIITGCAANGVSEVVLVKGDCAACDHATGMAMAEEVCASASELLRVWGCQMPVRIADRFPASTRSTSNDIYDENRRTFFFRVGDKARDAAVVAADVALGGDPAEQAGPGYLKVMDDGTLPHFVPDRRERLLDDLASLGEPADEFVESRLWGHVVIDTGLCTGCRMCATFCPTGAIVKFDEADGTMGVDHYPGDCVKCRCCENICQAHAVTVHDSVLADDIHDGMAQRYVLPRPEIEQDNPKKGMLSMRKLTGFEGIWER